MKTIRILHVVYILDRGGMENRIMDIYRNLDREKYQYDFYVESGRTGAFCDEIIRLGGRVYYSKGKGSSSFPDFRAFRAFLKDHPEYKTVFAYNQWAGFYLKEAKKCGVVNRVANSRTSIQTRSLKNTVKNLVKTNVNKYATVRFAVSKKAANWLFGKKRTDSGDVAVWPNAIDAGRYAFSETVREEVREKLGLGQAFTVIHVGNIKYEKNHPFLLEVFSQIVKRRPDAKLVLIGGGDFGTLKPLTDGLNIGGRVIYLGIRKDVPDLLQAGDAFVFPSFYEGFPGAVLEAQASGLNCVISDSITDEVLLTDHAVALPISAGAAVWAEKVDSFGVIDRSHEWERIKEVGYDVKDLALRMQTFFDSLCSD